jgi:hypothetical protein
VVQGARCVVLLVSEHRFWEDLMENLEDVYDFELRTSRHDLER